MLDYVCCFINCIGVNKMSDPEPTEPEEEEEEITIFDPDEWAKEKGWVSKADMEKMLEGYEPKRTKAIKKARTKKPPKEPKEETKTCSRCGGELKQTEQGWYRCQKCGRGFIL